MVASGVRRSGHAATIVHDSSCTTNNYHDTTQLPTTSFSKKNDDEVAPNNNNVVALLQLSLQRSKVHLRMLPPSKRRLIVLVTTLLVTLSTTIYYTAPARYFFTFTVSRRNRALDNVPHAPRMVQLGPTTISRRQRGSGEWIPLNGSGDPTVATSIQSRLPRKGDRELIERYNPLPHDAPKLRPASELHKGKCQPMHEWQTTHRPSCNVVHESSFGFEHPLGWNYDQVTDGEFDYYQVRDEGKLFLDMGEQVRLVASGAYRSVWMIREYDGTKRALKTLRIDEKTSKFDLRNFDRHRRDAVAMDQLTKSKLIVDMYGYCSNSGLFDWGEGGDLTNIFDVDKLIPTKERLLKIAYNISMSVHDAHNFDDKGRATIAHTDVKTDQFLFKDGYYRLSDFNRVRFLLWNEAENSTCGFRVPKNGGSWRAPEEYAYEEESEKVDVYSLGNVLYFLLTKTDPWVEFRSKTIYENVMEGKRPEIPKEILESDSIYDRHMIQAIKMAWTHDQYKRPGALEVAQRLMEGIQEYEASGQVTL
jgi:serine/threonine protein kinase